MRLFTIIFCLFISFSTIAQSTKRISRAEYISMYKDDAIREMHRSGVPASITLAQGILESGDGNSALARKANNHFGIKCHASWKGKTYHQDDDSKDECFRKYKNVLESFHDHSEFLQRPRYAKLFELKPTDYKGWAKGLKDAGYATNPRYPQLLIKIIEDNNLHQYDLKSNHRASKKAPKSRDGKSIWSQKTEKGEYSERNRGKSNAHIVKVHANNIRYIVVDGDDTFEKVAEEFNMGLWQLYKYNDIDKGEETLRPGILFLQPKRNRAQDDYHYVTAGESMWDISQKHGIKLKKLYRKNRMSPKDRLQAGDKLYLKSNKPRD